MAKKFKLIKSRRFFEFESLYGKVEIKEDFDIGKGRSFWITSLKEGRLSDGEGLLSDEQKREVLDQFLKLKPFKNTKGD
jgi:hypothetical protein